MIMAKVIYTYWKEIAIALIASLLIGYVWILRSENAKLKLDKAKIETASKILSDEYKTNIIEFEKKRVITEVVFKDRVKVIERRVDENSSCKDIINSLDSYQY